MVAQDGSCETGAGNEPSKTPQHVFRRSYHSNACGNVGASVRLATVTGYSGACGGRRRTVCQPVRSGHTALKRTHAHTHEAVPLICFRVLIDRTMRVRTSPPGRPVSLPLYCLLCATLSHRATPRAFASADQSRRSSHEPRSEFRKPFFSSFFAPDWHRAQPARSTS